MNYFPFHVGDYMAHTAHLDDLEDLAYRRMLDAYYLRERALPADPAEVAKLIRMRKHLAVVESVLKEFFVLKDAGWSSERCDAEIAKMQEKQAKAQTSSFLGVAARRAKAMTERLANGQPNGSPDGQPNGHQVGQPNGDLPTPTPTPTPLPNSSSLRSEESADKSAPSRKTGLKTLKTYLEECKEAGRKPLPADHPVRDYCRDAGISDDMLAVAWCVFRDDYTTGTAKDKKYKDWPGHFANAVRGCWAKLWYTDGPTVAWTSRGQQEKAVLDARAKAREGAHEST